MRDSPPNRSRMKKKVLLMGKNLIEGASIKSIVFDNHTARKITGLNTFKIEHTLIRFFRSLMLDYWDCRIQEAFMNNNFANEQVQIFSHLDIFIYVFDVCDKESEEDLKYYQSFLKAVNEISSSANVYCLLHREGLLPTDDIDQVCLELEKKIMDVSKPIKCTCFKTSIENETLYRAWSTILSLLVPNIQQIEQGLMSLSSKLDCDEVLLFDRTTLLIISSYVRNYDKKRSENVTVNAIQRFKSNCKKIHPQFLFMEMRISNFAVFIEEFTRNTYIMVVKSNRNACSVEISANIENVRQHFEELENPKVVH